MRLTQHASMPLSHKRASEENLYTNTAVLTTLKTRSAQELGEHLDRALSGWAIHVQASFEEPQELCTYWSRYASTKIHINSPTPHLPQVFLLLLNPFPPTPPRSSTDRCLRKICHLALQAITLKKSRSTPSGKTCISHI